MFSKTEEKALKSEFWTRFKEKMGVHKGEHGRRINWINYPTQVKQLFVRLHADAKIAKFSIDIQAKDDGIRALFWEQMNELKKVMEETMNTSGNWEETAYNDAGQKISQISWELHDVNMYKKEDQQKIYDFFAPLLLRFHDFYADYKEILIGLAK